MACLNFTLYLNSTFPRNLWRNDIRNLTKLCQEFAGGHYSIDILHFETERQRAFHDGVINTPTILLEQPSGRKKILGNLAETEGFLRLLNPARAPEPGTFSVLTHLLGGARAERRQVA